MARMTAILMTAIVATAMIGTTTAARAVDAMDPDTCPMHAQHMAAAAAATPPINAAPMGFDQGKTTHHFTLLADGGAIQVEANDPADAASRDMIRTHLRTIAAAFQAGDFGIPSQVHGQVVPGTGTMALVHADIRYGYEETPRGARVRITTTSPIAIAAVHDFLRYQIVEHRTGDPMEAAAAR